MAKGCYTCRRRRIICDNGQPTCRKCHDAGKECLGYQKPLVWVKGGVASRGKMMGRSFDDVKKPTGQLTQQSFAQTESSAAKCPDFNISTIVESSSETVPDVSPDVDAWALSPFDTAFDTVTGEESILSSNRFEEPVNMMVHVSRGSPTEYMPTPWGLVDPLVQDLTKMTRFYIHHYNEHVAECISLYPQFNNPWRDLIALVGSSSLLANSLAALGAIHYSLIGNSESEMPWSSPNLAASNPILTPAYIERMVTPSTSRHPTSKAYRHFLELKQRTLNQLSKDLSKPELRYDARIPAVIVVLALLDIFESGSGAWSYHIEGAKKLLNHRQVKQDNELGEGILQGLETFAVDGCLIMEIMGSTLARPGALSKPFYTTMGSARLKRLEGTSWVGCPAYLLEIIFYVHTLWYPDPEAASAIPQPTNLPMALQCQSLTHESFVALLQSIHNFDPVNWAQDMQAHFFIPDLSTRITLARCYKAAIYLYTSRVLSRPREGFSPSWDDIGVPSDHSAIAHDLIAYICSVPVSDPHFKCFIWPTFIAGAECRRFSQRTVILEKLGALYQSVLSVNVRNAAWVLRLMWQKQDLKQRKDLLQDGVLQIGIEDDFDGTFDWIDELDEYSLDWLFI
ncbi:hypothetical protein N7495_008212 [Penicillium taxi]|uniref:uncharacterized protein n=1 Tax=Penicillium taxi TaxID=168475 RepID=UPI0025452E7F|nr:uncharacterized protein N7495_008212 [Penicillium taxi]KAJ5888171.1 hypothetical protein N7495_008212 [Penicillium taxi]